MITVVARHESTSLLRSGQTWTMAALLAGLFGFLFLRQLEVFIDVQAQLATQDHPTGLSGFMSVRYLEPLSLAFTLVAPLFAMRSFSDEFRQQTYALWQSSPVSTTSLVVGKFLGVLSVLTGLVLLSVMMLLLMRVFVALDLTLLLTAFLGLLLCAAACTACGLYFSSLTKHSLIAIVSSLALLLILWIIGSASSSTFALQGLSALSLATHLHGFFQGYIRTADLAYFILMIVLFLGLTIIRLDALRQHGR